MHAEVSAPLVRQVLRRNPSSLWAQRSCFMAGRRDARASPGQGYGELDHLRRRSEARRRDPEARPRAQSFGQPWSVAPQLLLSGDTITVAALPRLTAMRTGPV